MHRIYTTPGFIAHSSPYGESGKFFLLFTRDFGMIGAMAQGVRLAQSKLRYHSQDYSYRLFSLVRGKEIWRLTGAGELPDQQREFIEAEDRRLYIRILSLLKRLLPGEEKNEKVFEVMDGLYKYLSRQNRGNISEERELAEYATVWRILFYLGYISNESRSDFHKDLMSKTVINEEILEEVKVSQKKIINEINNALKESQL